MRFLILCIRYPLLYIMDYLPFGNQHRYVPIDFDEWLENQSYRANTFQTIKKSSQFMGERNDNGPEV